jgi:hypothetical protein
MKKGVIFEAIAYKTYVGEGHCLSLVRLFNKTNKNSELKVDVQKGP